MTVALPRGKDHQELVAREEHAVGRPIRQTGRGRAGSAKSFTRRWLVPTCKVRPEGPGGGQAAENDEKENPGDVVDDRVPLPDLDIIFLSYEQMRKELSKRQESHLIKFGFWRIMLDEAQLVANSNSVAAVMASGLWRRHAWVITGTPVSSKLDEVKGLLEFLALEPFYHSHAWRSLLHQPYQQQQLAGLLSLRGLLKGVMLRRSKKDVENQLQLPSCTREDLVVKLAHVERTYYEQIKKRYIQTLETFRSSLLRERNNQRSGSGGGNVKKVRRRCHTCLSVPTLVCLFPHLSVCSHTYLSVPTLICLFPHLSVCSHTFLFRLVRV